MRNSPTICTPNYSNAQGQEGYQVAGPVREIYMSNPEETPAGQLRTELQLPVV